MMIKVITVLVALAALTGILYGVFLFKNTEKIYVFVESGNVFTKASEGGAYALISEKKIAVNDGAYVKTGIGLAHILFPDNSVISVGENSEIKIAYTKQKISVTQFVGDTYHRVQKLVNGSTYEVSTSGTVASVRGTKFAVRYDRASKSAKVAVTENIVLVSRIVSATTTRTEVSSGTLATVDETMNPGNGQSTINLSQTKDDPSIQLWIKRNVLMDEYIGADAKTFLDDFIKTEANGTDIDALRVRLIKTKNLSYPTHETEGTSTGNPPSSGPQECTYSYEANNVKSSVTMYISEGKMRTDMSTSYSGTVMKNSIIQLDKKSYTWTEGESTGYMMTVPNMPQTDIQNGSHVQSVTSVGEVNYSCTPWAVDSKVFELPHSINFIDTGQYTR